MKILGINPGHNGSAAYVVNGELEWYIEEERLSRKKYDGNPFRGILHAINEGVDLLVIGGTEEQEPTLKWNHEDVFTGFVRKFNPNLKVVDLGKLHHLGHASEAFYNSGFETAAAVIVDGAGSYVEKKLREEEEKSPVVGGFETESIFKCAYPANFQTVYRSLGGNPGTTFYAEGDGFKFSDAVTITKVYEAVSHYLGFGFIEAGKTMGLAPYGQHDDSIPDLFVGDRGNKNVLVSKYPAGAVIDYSRYDSLKLKEDSTVWHHDPGKVKDVYKNLAWKVQQETQRLVGDLIEKAHKATGETNIVVAGGYGLNCVANYYFLQRFPDLNIYVDPISHDGGTSIGAAKLLHHSETQDKKIRPLSTLYTGVTRPDYKILPSIIERNENIKLKDTTHAEVAQLLADRNIVLLFQGRSEAGPRALGNRSILYDPTDPNGKDYVNTVKGREWFRPFAGSMLAENFDQWFVTHGLKESPYMMYAMEVKKEKRDKIPAITHVDGTCRIQTVTHNQNKHYYGLIEEFYKLTGVPILFNTSFNLAGEPLVETIEDAINTMIKSNIKYLYLPEIGKIVKLSKS